MESSSEPAPNYVSQRAMRALTPALSYGQAFGAAQARKWSESDPGGNIICSIAENKLTADMLHAKMVSVQQDVPVSTMSYPSNFKGSLEARQAMAHMMKRTFMKGIDVQADHLALLAGAGACLDLLFWCLAAPGEGVLLPSPIYPAFVNDMEVRGACHLVLFELDEGRGVAEQMDLAAAGAKAEGHPIKILILANPNNPMGIVYKRDTVRDILLWCLKNHVHFISDEIYALSVWGEGGPEFVSTEVVAQQEAAEGTLTPAQLDLIPQLLHTVCGLSKDFCASGLRVGVLHTRNPTLMKAIDNLCYFHTCSAPMTWTMSQILLDDMFMDAFIAENNKRMRSAYKGLADGLDQAGIPYVRATAAMFCWVDLRAGLKEPGWEGERELWRALIEVGVLLTPGEACRAAAPGFFRICWAWCPAAALPHAARRMGQLLDQRRTQQHKVAPVTAGGTE